MKIRLPQYSGRDYLVLAITILPLTLALNSIIFGKSYYTGNIFLPATLLTALVFCVDFILCGALAMLLKQRIPDEMQTPRRLFLMIVCFVALSGIFLLTVFHGYEMLPSFNYTYNEK